MIKRPVPVFGLGTAATAEYAVLDHWARKPDALNWQQAASVAVAAETAARVLAALGMQPGQTLLIDNASGAVGQAATQLARPSGVTVVGTASEANHTRLRDLGVIPVTYGPGLPERVDAATSKTIDAAIDAAGRGSVPELVQLTGSPNKVITIADSTAGRHSVAVNAEPSE